jgi:hypothetical protein
MPVGHFAVFMGGGGVLLGLFVLAEIVVMRRLMVMMRGGVMVSGGVVMMLARRMLGRFGHVLALLQVQNPQAQLRH